MFFPRRREIIGGPTGRLGGPARRAATYQPDGVQHLEDRVVLTFLAPVSYAAGTNPSGIAVADFNGDGKSDLAVVNNAVAGTVDVMLSNGNGTFQPPVNYAGGAGALDARAGDFNGDGKVRSGRRRLAGGGHPAGQRRRVLRGPEAIRHRGRLPRVVIGDFNNDGTSKTNLNEA